jgi:hypothetical protein
VKSVPGGVYAESKTLPLAHIYRDCGPQRGGADSNTAPPEADLLQAQEIVV